MFTFSAGPVIKVSDFGSVGKNDEIDCKVLELDFMWNCKVNVKDKYIL